ncbi:hypothetical protein SAMN02745673_04193 [Marinactinospora thermotolerans DSM 45154]|uniref:Uncharacterized protein n=1 Tax=Marinactinospora thermotolerans DSM 45154 TaxID=1122192 RepID=A0A1T4SYY1_9ACTN|nr:hypothetical protein SAMN02745673_04193 [Marinactinospora thermotolerans DSM 45154]
MDEATARQVREMVAKGAMGGRLILATDDCRKTYELLERGVEFTDPPLRRPYGIDCGLRAPFGDRDPDRAARPPSLVPRRPSRASPDRPMAGSVGVGSGQSRSWRGSSPIPFSLSTSSNASRIASRASSGMLR